MGAAIVRRLFALLALLFLPLTARAEVGTDRFSAGGYVRVMTRPDAQGGGGKLGFYNLYGRLLNEGPYAALEMKLDLLPPRAASGEPWANVHLKAEGGSVANADFQNGGLQNFRLSQLYVQAGNVGLKDVVWQLGTLDYYWGDLGLYDMRPAEIFFDTVGASGMYKGKAVDWLVGAGDAGYFLRGANYSTVFTGGTAARVRISPHLELGGGGQLYYEPEVAGNPNAPYTTEGINYVDLVRQDAILQYMMAHPSQSPLNFPCPGLPPCGNPAPASSLSWKIVGYLGFGNIGPIVWNSLFANYLLKHPDNFYLESGSYLPPGAPSPTVWTNLPVYVRDYTAHRYQLNVGDQVIFHIIPERLDGALAGILSDDNDLDNTIAPSDNNQLIYSGVLRLQYYLSGTVHLLGETSAAKEFSRNGNRYRDHVDSIFQNTRGVSDTKGLEYGDDNQRTTYQWKGGVVLQPTGPGIFTRPSLRFLYGLQWSTQNEAWGNPFPAINQPQSSPLVTGTTEAHWHSVVALEAEAWF